MTKQEVMEKVNDFLVEDFEIEQDVLLPENLIKEDVGIDSLDIVDIIVTVKDVFGVKLEKKDMATVKTLDDFYELVLKATAN